MLPTPLLVHGQLDIPLIAERQKQFLWGLAFIILLSVRIGVILDSNFFPLAPDRSQIVEPSPLPAFSVIVIFTPS